MVAMPHLLGTVTAHATWPASVEENGAWKQSLFWPAYAVALSAVALLLQRIEISRKHGRLDANSADNHANHLAQYLDRCGRATAMILDASRFLCCLILLFLSVSFFPSETVELSSEYISWTRASLCGTYLYATILSLTVVTTREYIRKLASRHLTLLLLLVWSIYVYRDVWPLATFTLVPKDAAEGTVLWAKIIMLTFVAVVLPIMTPLRHAPLDPQEPMPPHPTQHASILSLILYAWLDRTVLKACSVTYLGLDDLPPLADDDHTKNLVKRAFPHIDPFQVRKPRHIFWGILTIFRKEYIVLCVMLACRKDRKSVV